MANNTLEMTFPKAPGASGTGLDSGHKLYDAYPGIPYRYYAAAVGGVPPYVFSISGQPSGMVIDSDTGEVTWSNPTTGTHSNITVSVTDEESSTDDATYDLVVGTSGFIFVDIAGGNDTTGTGSLAAPWQTLDKLYDQTSVGASFLYLRAGTYTLAGVPTNVGADPHQVTCTFSQSAGRVTTWMAYPGESVTIDFESDHVLDNYKPSLELVGDRCYVDGIHFLDAYNKAIWASRASGRGIYIINCHFDGLGPGIESSNSGMIEFRAQALDASENTYNDCIIGNTCSNMIDSAEEFRFSSFKFYTTTKLYVAFNTMIDNMENQETLAPKQDVIQFMFYRNTILYPTSMIGTSTGCARGNLARSSGEYWYNRFRGGAWSPDNQFSLAFNQQGNATDMYFERNTFQGSIVAENVSTTDGPFVFRNNVIINAEGGNAVPYLSQTGVTDISPVSIVTSGSPTGTQNLAGNAAAGIIDSNGLLQGSYRTSYLGGWGHEIVTAAETRRVTFMRR